MSIENLSQKGHFLALDDQINPLTMLRTLLTMNNYQVDIFQDPEQALAKLEDSPEVDGFFTDYEIGQVNGISVARRARDFYKGPIALVTANVGVEDIQNGHGELDIQNAYKAGLIIDILKKPFRMADVKRTISLMTS